MTKELEWSKEVYESSLSSRCWWYTPYDEGWTDGVGIAVDDELRQIVETRKRDRQGDCIRSKALLLFGTASAQEGDGGLLPVPGRMACRRIP
jgi:hypothetical protein